jgi:hypothetical protein
MHIRISLLTAITLAQMIWPEFGPFTIRKPVQDFFLFLVGGALFVAGIFLFTSRVIVDSGFTGMGWGRNYNGGIVTSFSGIFRLALVRVLDY